jgi:hypothetical protein
MGSPLGGYGTTLAGFDSTSEPTAVEPYVSHESLRSYALSELYESGEIPRPQHVEQAPPEQTRRPTGRGPKIVGMGPTRYLRPPAACAHPR